MNVDQGILHIAQLDLLLFALCLVLGTVVAWMPYGRERLSGRRLLYLRLGGLPFALFAVLAVVLSASDPDSVPLFIWPKLSFLAWLTPIFILFTAMNGVTFLYALERALGHDGKRYERMATTMTGWLARLVTFYPSGTFVATPKRASAKKRAPAKQRQTK